MGEKHPDRTNEWDHQQKTLRKIYAGLIPPNKTKDDKKANQ